MDTSLKISVIIPYNKDRGYLYEAIDSCMDQDNMTIDVDYELIIQKGDYGLCRNVNDAVRKAKGKYIKICAEDDRLTTNCLYDLYHMAELGDYDIVCANGMNIEGDENARDVVSKIPESVSQLAVFNTIHGGSTLYLKSSMPPWNEDLWTAEEYELHLNMAARGCKFGYIDSLVYIYRNLRYSKSNFVKEYNGETRKDALAKLRSIYINNHTPIMR